MEPPDHVIAYYSQYDEDERLSRHRLEWDMTWRHLEDVLPPTGRVLEVGCATGRYSLELARRGYEVVGLDPVPQQITHARARAAEADLMEELTFAVGNAQDLSQFPDASFDAVLLLGPLYHLSLKQARERSVYQARRVLVSGGLIGSAFISRIGMLGSLLVRHSSWALSEEVEPILQKGYCAEPLGAFSGYFATDAEAIDLHEAAGFSTLHLAALEPAIGACESAYNELSPELQAAWLDILYRISTEPIMLGSSCHWLYLGKK